MISTDTSSVAVESSRWHGGSLSNIASLKASLLNKGNLRCWAILLLMLPFPVAHRPETTTTLELSMDGSIDPCPDLCHPALLGLHRGARDFQIATWVRGAPSLTLAHGGFVFVVQAAFRALVEFGLFRVHYFLRGRLSVEIPSNW